MLEGISVLVSAISVLISESFSQYRQEMLSALFDSKQQRTSKDDKGSVVLVYQLVQGTWLMRSWKISRKESLPFRVDIAGHDELEKNHGDGTCNAARKTIFRHGPIIGTYGRVGPHAFPAEDMVRRLSNLNIHSFTTS